MYSISCLMGLGYTAILQEDSTHCFFDLCRPESGAAKPEQDAANSPAKHAEDSACSPAMSDTDAASSPGGPALDAVDASRANSEACAGSPSEPEQDAVNSPAGPSLTTISSSIKAKTVAGGSRAEPEQESGNSPTGPFLRPVSSPAEPQHIVGGSPAGPAEGCSHSLTDLQLDAGVSPVRPHQDTTKCLAEPALSPAVPREQAPTRPPSGTASSVKAPALAATAAHTSSTPHTPRASHRAPSEGPDTLSADIVEVSETADNVEASLVGFKHPIKVAFKAKPGHVNMGVFDKMGADSQTSSPLIPAANTSKARHFLTTSFTMAHSLGQTVEDDAQIGLQRDANVDLLQHSAQSEVPKAAVTPAGLQAAESKTVSTSGIATAGPSSAAAQAADMEGVDVAESPATKAAVLTSLQYSNDTDKSQTCTDVSGTGTLLPDDAKAVLHNTWRLTNAAYHATDASQAMQHSNAYNQKNGEEHQTPPMLSSECSLRIIRDNEQESMPTAPIVDAAEGHLMGGPMPGSGLTLFRAKGPLPASTNEEDSAATIGSDRWVTCNMQSGEYCLTTVSKHDNSSVCAILHPVTFSITASHQTQLYLQLVSSNTRRRLL